MANMIVALLLSIIVVRVIIVKASTYDNVAAPFFFTAWPEVIKFIIVHHVSFMPIGIGHDDP
jgi:hypothetical protein